MIGWENAVLVVCAAVEIWAKFKQTIVNRSLAICSQFIDANLHARSKGACVVTSWSRSPLSRCEIPLMRFWDLTLKWNTNLLVRPRVPMYTSSKQSPHYSSAFISMTTMELSWAAEPVHLWDRENLSLHIFERRVQSQRLQPSAAGTEAQPCDGWKHSIYIFIIGNKLLFSLSFLCYYIYEKGRMFCFLDLLSIKKMPVRKVTCSGN